MSCFPCCLLHNTTTISVDEATEQLYSELLHPSDKMSQKWLLGLLARSSKPSPDAEAFDPALCAALQQWLVNTSIDDTHVSQLPLWFATALVHQGLAGAAGLHWLGKGAVDGRYIL
jgi:hypothetical protein